MIDLEFDVEADFWIKFGDVCMLFDGQRHRVAACPERKPRYL